MKRIEIYTVCFSVPKLVTTCYPRDLANTLERLDLLGKCVILRTSGDLHDGDVVEAVGLTPIERRPTLDELQIGCFVKVRGWDEMFSEGRRLDERGAICFDEMNETFEPEMKKYCGNTYKVSSKLGFIYLDGCVRTTKLGRTSMPWAFTIEMLTYVAPEAVK